MESCILQHHHILIFIFDAAQELACLDKSEGQ